MLQLWTRGLFQAEGLLTDLVDFYRFTFYSEKVFYSHQSMFQILGYWRLNLNLNCAVIRLCATPVYVMFSHSPPNHIEAT